MHKFDAIIIGAGVIGLAISRQLSKKFKNILVLEKNDSFGKETSSRNSEVVHTGIYYKKNSLKTKTCIEGRSLLYEYAQKNKISYRKIGKLILATSKDEENKLFHLLENAKNNCVENVHLFDANKINELHPGTKCLCGIHSEETGIIDVHSFMKHLEAESAASGTIFAYNSKVISIKRNSRTYVLEAIEKNEGLFNAQTDILINAAGLESEKIANICGIYNERYHLKYCKGDYFRLSSKKAKRIHKLIYPTPKSSSAGLGIHVTPDLAGGVKIGPDHEYIDRDSLAYDIDLSKKNKFYESVSFFLRFIEENDLSPDTSGIRPRLYEEGEEERDFIINEESEKGFPGFINLIGIESPGITGSLSIANFVTNTLIR